MKLTVSGSISVLQPYNHSFLIQPSTSSRYYILNDWQSTYTDEKNVPPFPAAKISSIMLKTMGILQVSV